SLAAAAFAYGYVRRAPVPPALIRSSLAMPEKTSLAMLALSPDGLRLAFTALDAQGKSALWVRPLHGEEAHLIGGTENAAFPFWSPDSRLLPFFAEKKLKRVDAAGGSVLSSGDVSADPVGGRRGRAGDVAIGLGGCRI